MNFWYDTYAFLGQAQLWSSSTALFSHRKKLQQHQTLQLRLAVARWGRVTQVWFRRWIIHSHEPRLLAVRLIFNSTCVSENLPPSTHQVPFPGENLTPASPQLCFLQTVRIALLFIEMTEMYRGNQVQCTLSCCVTGLGESLNIIRAVYQTPVLFSTDRNVFVAPSSKKTSQVLSWHWVSAQICYLVAYSLIIFLDF